jgi:hypothetical protein
MSELEFLFVNRGLDSELVKFLLKKSKASHLNQRDHIGEDIM